MLKTRILTGGILAVAVVLTTLFAPTPLAVAVLGSLWLVGAHEWGRLAGAGNAGCIAFAVLLVAIVAALAATGFGSATALAVIWCTVPAIVLAAVGLARFPRVFPPPVVLLIGLLSLVPSCVAIGYLHVLDPALALAGIVIIWGADVGAFVVGRTLGRRKLAPAISPGKTRAGAVGGIAAASAIAAVAAAVLALPVGFVLVAAIAAAASIVGDLSVSLLKRHAGLKDSGRLLPGHGGALDRIDGLTTGLPIIAIGLKFALILD